VTARSAADPSAEYYERFPKRLNRRNFEHYFARRWSAVRRAAPDAAAAPGRVLELGCGEGHGLRALARAAGEAPATVVGLDYAWTMVRSAAADPGLRGRVLQADAAAVPFGEGSFDLVYSNALLHHIPDAERAVAEALRVCRPGGAVVFVEPNRWHPLMIAYGVLDRAERGTLRFSRRRLERRLRSDPRVGEVSVRPLNTFLYSYRGFPPARLFPLVRRIERLFDLPHVASQWLFVARRRARSTPRTSTAGC